MGEFGWVGGWVRRLLVQIETHYYHCYVCLKQSEHIRSCSCQCNRHVISNQYHLIHLQMLQHYSRRWQELVTGLGTVHSAMHHEGDN